MQIKDNKDMIPRSVFYASKLLSEQIYGAKTYTYLKNVVVISLLNYIMFKDTNEYHNIYNLREIKTGKKLTEIIEFHYIELPKFEKFSINNTKLTGWLDFINGQDKEKINMAIKSNKIVKYAYTKYQYLEGDAELKRLEEIQLIQRLDDNSAIERATKQGIDNTKIDVVKSMAQNNIDIKTIIAVTKLTEHEILKILKEF